jgi:hypothetical protein
MPSPTDMPGIILPVPPPTTSIVARGRIHNASPGPTSSWLKHEMSIDRLVLSITIHPCCLHLMPNIRAFDTPPGHSLALATTTLHAPWPSLALRSASHIGSPLAQTDPSEAHPSHVQTDLRQCRHHPTREEQSIMAAAPAATSHRAALASTATIHTTLGGMHLCLFPQQAPKAVENFLATHTAGITMARSSIGSYISL